jgi:Divergent InlB B-repeat domain
MHQAPHRGFARLALLALCVSTCLFVIPSSSQASEATEGGGVEASLASSSELEPICWIEPWYCNTEMATVNVKKYGTGSGVVTSSPAGINCGIYCSGQFPVGSLVTLTAKANEGSKFTGWAGGYTGVSDGCSGTGTCKIPLVFIRIAIFPPPPPPPVSVAATFDLESKPSLDLTASKAGTGSGTITSSPPGINCGSTCTAEFEEGSTVKLTAAADPGYEFREWSGSCSGISATCEVTMSEAKSVSAQFAAKRTKALTLTKSGAGSVKSNPKGIACGSACTTAVGQYFKDTSVVLTAKAMTDGALEGWEGCDSSTNTGLEGTCTVAMSEARNVKATFKPAAKPLVNPQTLTLTKAGTGTGTVKGAWLACEAACTATEVSYFGGVTEPKPKAATTVTLIAAPTLGSEFAGWEGCDSEPEGKCVVSMGEAREVTVKFE